LGELDEAPDRERARDGEAEGEESQERHRSGLVGGQALGPSHLVALAAQRDVGGSGGGLVDLPPHPMTDPVCAGLIAVRDDVVAFAARLPAQVDSGLHVVLPQERVASTHRATETR
ncbi:hypothetical protein KXW37_004066, partial [Aspergillus fumigatus]